MSLKKMKAQIQTQTRNEAERPSEEHILKIGKVEIDSAKGKRDHMEDMIYCSEKLVNNRFYIAIVCDGHNGSLASTFITTAMNHLSPKILLETTDPLIISRLLSNLFDTLGVNFQKKKVQDGSTISGVVVDAKYGYIHIINLGDSQTILYGLQGKIQYVSHRDSTDIIEERKRLINLGIPIQKDIPQGPYRMYGLNMTKAFGNYHTGLLDKALTKSHGRKIKIDTFSIPKSQQNITVLIGSDGLFDEIQGEHLAEIPIFRRMCPTKLIQFVSQHGIKGDNISVCKFQISRTARIK